VHVTLLVAGNPESRTLVRETKPTVSATDCEWIEDAENALAGSIREGDTVGVGETASARVSDIAASGKKTVDIPVTTSAGKRTNMEDSATPRTTWVPSVGRKFYFSFASPGGDFYRSGKDCSIGNYEFPARYEPVYGPWIDWIQADSDLFPLTIICSRWPG